MKDFHRYHVGDKVYFAGYDSNFPEESEVSDYEVLDASDMGMIRIRDVGWLDPNDPSEDMYPTMEMAQNALNKMKERGKRYDLH